jgi:hypothetical protein
MNITKEALAARLELLNKQRLQAFANLSAFDGAIEDCKFWLAQLSPEPASEETPNV